MPALSVTVDGVLIATVCTDGYDVLSVRAGGTRIDDHLANLDVAGGSYPENKETGSGLTIDIQQRDSGSCI